MRSHEGVAHGGPMIVSVIEIAGPRLFLVIARVQRGIEGGDRRFDRPPFPLAALIFRYPGLQVSLVLIRALAFPMFCVSFVSAKKAEADPLALDQEIAELYADKVSVRDPLLDTSGGRQ